MKAMAAKQQPSNDFHRQHQEVIQAPLIQNEFPSTDAIVLQRMSACPCDGGCPSCVGDMVIQPKLRIGVPGDRYEREADRVADEVVSRFNTPHRKAIQHQGFFKEIEEYIQMKPLAQQIHSFSEQNFTVGREMSVTPNLEMSIRRARGDGNFLPERVREPIEEVFGTDFSKVRIHTDAVSHRQNQALKANAFTMGQDIFFREGAYNPGNNQGRELLVHELTHVMQQKKSKSSTKIIQLSPTTDFQTALLLVYEEDIREQLTMAINSIQLADLEEAEELFEMLTNPCSEESLAYDFNTLLNQEYQADVLNYLSARILRLRDDLQAVPSEDSACPVPPIECEAEGREGGRDPATVRDVETHERPEPVVESEPRLYQEQRDLEARIDQLSPGSMEWWETTDREQLVSREIHNRSLPFFMTAPSQEAEGREGGRNPATVRDVETHERPEPVVESEVTAEREVEPRYPRFLSTISIQRLYQEHRDLEARIDQLSPGSTEWYDTLDQQGLVSSEIHNRGLPFFMTAPSQESEREVIAGSERRGPTLAPEPWHPPIPPPRRSESIVPYERPETSIVPYERPETSIVPARRILLDASVIGEINRGNVHAARTLQALLRSSARIEIATQSFGELTAQPGRPVTHIGPSLPRTAVANRYLLRDLQISVAPTVGSVRARANAYAIVETNMGGNISVADRINLVQAGLLNAEFWTLERRLPTQEVPISLHLGVRLAPEYRTVHVPSGAGVQRPREDYRVARRLLGLEPITVPVTDTVSRPPAGRGGPPRGGTPPVPSVSSTGTSIIPAPIISIVPHTESTPRGETVITVHAEFEPARGTTAIVPHPESEPGRSTAVIPHPESIRPSQASSGSGRRHRPARRAASAAGGVGALISVINDYLVMLESYRELERTVQSYNSTFFARIGGECYQHWYTHGIVTVCAPPSPARLRQWLEGNIHTWREFEAFYDTAYITGFDIYQGQYGFHIGSSFYAGPTEESIDEVIRETIRRLEETERETIEQIRAVGRMEVRFRNHIPTDDRQVYRLSARGVRSFLEPLCEGSALPTNAQFFIVGAARGVRWGSWSTRFYQVEGANVATVRAMRGQRGLVSVNDVYQVVTSRGLLED